MAIPTATMPMQQRPRQASPALHPAIVESAQLFTNALEENEDLKSNLRRLQGDMELMRRENENLRQRVEYWRAQTELYQRERAAQNADLDVICRTVAAARDRANQRSGQ